MWPGASVSGYYLWNPASHYFGVGRIGRDQLADYAARKGVPVAERSAGWRRIWLTTDSRPVGSAAPGAAGLGRDEQRHGRGQRRVTAGSVETFR